jgi:hypothetical protein
MAVLAIILFLCGFALCHGSGWYIVAGLACFGLGAWIGAKANKTEEEKNNPRI